MSILGSLAVNLIANTSKFDKGMKRSRAQVTAFGSAIKGLAAPLAATFGATALTGFARNQLQMIDTLGKTSRQLGISTEALGAYQHAAQLSGLETNQLNESMKRMQDTIGAAMMGEAGAIRAFETLGLSAEQLSKSTTPLEDIQRSITKIGNQNTKIAVIRDIFGRSGAGMLNLFESNLAGVRKEYEALGLAVTSEEAKRIEQLNDSMFTLGETFKGLGRRMLIDATPRLIEAVKGLNVIMEAIGFLKPEQKQAKQTMIGRGLDVGVENLARVLTPIMQINEGGFGNTATHYLRRISGAIDMSPAEL